MFDYKKLDKDSWFEISDQIYTAIKPEIQGTKGFIRSIKNRNDEERKKSINDRIENFKGMYDLSKLDDQINLLANDFLKINNKHSQTIYYDHLAFLADDSLCEGKNALLSFRVAINDNSLNSIAHQRLAAVFARVVNESLGQANKSNAGAAGENLVRAILMASGLQKDRHYREQYKSSSGSDTDFVFPAVEDGRDQDVDLFLAVQISTNDRARLATSELKTGAKPFAFTGNGLNASSKKMKDIGNQIIEQRKKSNIKTICYSLEIEYEKCRLKRLIGEEDDAEKNQQWTDRLEYMNDFTISFSEFASDLKSRYIK